MTDTTHAALEALKAENEALRAEVERLRTDGASAVRWAPGSAYWSEVLVELFGPDARKGIDVLETRWRKELERAERLAEALRELEEREQRDEALLRQALEALGRAHQTAMEQTLKARVSKPCVYCGANERIGIDRINSSLGYSVENCEPCCADCNYAKRDMDKETFLNLIARIYAHQSR
jgi:DNA repair exonuclease SbcCD ATPase subunit